MRILGYPADRISILTTYNGQKNLLRDVANFRCANHPLFGLPAKIETVDRYQGQQNDYILLSLVRTKNVGHLRDVRRLVVATSRARLGLYIFGRWSLFSDCYELRSTFEVLQEVPRVLAGVPTETFAERSVSNSRLAGERPAHPVAFTYETLMVWLQQRAQAWSHQQQLDGKKALLQQQQQQAAVTASGRSAANGASAKNLGVESGVPEAGAEDMET